jgi:hypothetical protein
MIGFHSRPAEMPVLTQAEMAEAVPVELANRISSPILTLQNLDADDYMGMDSDVFLDLPKRLRGTMQMIAEQTVRTRWTSPWVADGWRRCFCTRLLRINCRKVMIVPPDFWRCLFR